MSSEALLPCPFCSDHAFAGTKLDGSYYVMCRAEDCWAMTGYLPTREEAITAWNRRPTSSPTSGELESLVERYSFLRLPGSSTLTPCVRPDGGWVRYVDAASQLAAVAAERDAAVTSRNAGTANFLTMQETAATLLKRALAAERLLAEAREALAEADAWIGECYRAWAPDGIAEPSDTYTNGELSRRGRIRKPLAALGEGGQ